MFVYVYVCVWNGQVLAFMSSCHLTGFARLLESPGFFVKFSDRGKS